MNYTFKSGMIISAQYIVRVKFKSGLATVSIGIVKRGKQLSAGT